MLITLARCSHCNASVALAPGWNFLRLPPYALDCENCGSLLRTSTNHRANWLFWSIWYTSGILISILFSILVFTQGYTGSELAVIAAVGSLILGGGGGAILALILQLPMQLLIDLSRAVLARLGLVKKQDLSHAIPLKEPIFTSHYK